MKKKTATATPTYREEKLKELAIHIAVKSQYDPSFGSVKLNKLLFYCDFRAFERFGKPITGVTYRKLEYGPCPSTMTRVKKELWEEKAAVEQKTFLPGGFEQVRLLALRWPNLDAFSGQEIALVDEVIEEFKALSATQISNKSHATIGWKLAQMGEDIPYETALIPAMPLQPSPDEVEYGKQLAAEL